MLHVFFLVFFVVSISSEVSARTVAGFT